MSSNEEYKINTNWELLLKDGKKQNTKKRKCKSKSTTTITVETNPFLQGKCLI